MIQKTWDKHYMQICSGVFSLLLGLIIALFMYLIGIDWWGCLFELLMTTVGTYWALEKNN